VCACGVPLPARGDRVAVRWYLRYGLSYRDVEELLVRTRRHGRPRDGVPTGAHFHLGVHLRRGRHDLATDHYPNDRLQAAFTELLNQPVNMSAYYGYG
jgi:hypothetical protein